MAVAGHRPAQLGNARGGGGGLGGLAERVVDSEFEVEHAAVDLADLGAERVLNLRYELGLLYMAAGRGEEALQSFREVFSVNPGFRETMNMIAKLSGKAGAFDLSDMDDVDIELEEIG